MRFYVYSAMLADAQGPCLGSTSNKELFQLLFSWVSSIVISWSHGRSVTSVSCFLSLISSLDKIQNIVILIIYVQYIQIIYIKMYSEN